jgi:retinol dehydrogenase 12
MKKQIALITGANSGIGLETAKALAKQNFDLILIVRSQAKANETVKLIQQVNPQTQIDSFIADLSDLAAVKSVATAISQKYPVIDRLICNAGFGPDIVEVHPSGLELSLVANHLGHFVLVNALMPNVEAAEDGRVINVASSAYKLGKAERMFQKNNTALSALQAYGDSKLANVLFTIALSKRLKKATTFSLHPGVINSNFGSNYTGFFRVMAAIMRPFMITPEKGAATTIYLATTPLANIKQSNGMFFDKSKLVVINSKEVTAEYAEMLWTKSLEEVDA